MATPRVRLTFMDANTTAEPEVSKPQFTMLDRLVREGGTCKLSGGPMAEGFWNRSCVKAIVARKWATRTPGAEGVAPTLTITTPGRVAHAREKARRG